MLGQPSKLRLLQPVVTAKEMGTNTELLPSVMACWQSPRDTLASFTSAAMFIVPRREGSRELSIKRYTTDLCDTPPRSRQILRMPNSCYFVTAIVHQRAHRTAHGAHRTAVSGFTWNADLLARFSTAPIVVPGLRADPSLP